MHCIMTVLCIVFPSFNLGEGKNDENDSGPSTYSLATTGVDASPYGLTRADNGQLCKLMGNYGLTEDTYLLTHIHTHTTECACEGFYRVMKCLKTGSAAG